MPVRITSSIYCTCTYSTFSVTCTVKHILLWKKRTFTCGSSCRKVERCDSQYIYSHNVYDLYTKLHRSITNSLSNRAIKPKAKYITHWSTALLLSLQQNRTYFNKNVVLLNKYEEALVQLTTSQSRHYLCYIT